MQALTGLGKHIQPGEGSPGVQNTALEKLMSQQKQEAPMLQALKAQGMQPQGSAPQGPPGAPMAPGGAAPGM